MHLTNRYLLKQKFHTFGVNFFLSLKNTIPPDFYHSPEGDVIFCTDEVDDKVFPETLVCGSLINILVVVQTGLATAEGLWPSIGLVKIFIWLRAI